MAIVPHIRDSVSAAKDTLARGREKLRRQHANGSPGIQVCSFLSDLLDTIILEIFRTALTDLVEDGGQGLESEVALVPHGGYGRRDVAPYSDVDLLLLHAPSAKPRVEKLARRLVMDLCDIGLDLGFSVRTPAQACALARQDPVIFTSQAEARHLAGSDQLFAGFMRRFRRQTRRRSRYLIQAIDIARRGERAKYGETVYLLEPNVKRSRGALRDIHLLRWIGFARYREADPESLRLLNVLSIGDERTLRKAVEFLLRLRNEMHFHAAKPYDVLYRGEQVRIAELWEYQGQEGVLPVEQFMRDYFEHTTRVRNIVGHLLATARQRAAILSVAAPLISHQVERDYRVGPIHISATRRGRTKLRGNLVEVLRLMDLANHYNKRIEHRTWQAIRDDMMGRTDMEVTEEAAARFLSLLSQTPRLGGLLRRLHELRVLEKLVVGMDHARCLVQFNTYHKYTVDEHCIRAVERAAEFILHPGLLGEVYRSVKQRAILHLALLIHDLGKGYPEDHSEAGEIMATETARRLKLKDGDAEMLRTLVHRHLLMSHLAFRRDTRDESVLLNFASDVGSAELLRMFLILTCADFAAVGPDVLSRWKIEVLTELYRRTLRHLSGTMSPDVDNQLKDARQAVLAAAPQTHAQWYSRQIKALPPAYLSGSEPTRLIEDLERLRQLGPEEAIAWGRYRKGRRVIEFTVGAHEGLVPGIFHRLTGALTSQGLQILSAEIHSLDDDLILDRFYVLDDDYAGQPPQERFDRISTALVSSLKHPTDARPSFRRMWQMSESRAEKNLQHLPTRVTVDNTTSHQYTVLDIFAHDRIGLLYTITRTLYDLGLSVGVAKIGTYLDQVVDVFYVTHKDGRKIEDESFLREIRHSVFRAIEAFEESEA